MSFERSSGVLLHLTSLPSPFGIGDMGKEAYKFVDFLKKSGQKLWQFLPIGPTGYANSPYACFSAFAGNPLLISLGLLIEQGLISPEDLGEVPDFPDEKVDYGKAIDYKNNVLEKAFVKFIKTATNNLKQDFSSFCEKNSAWLDDYALFMAIKGYYETEEKEKECKTWVDWDSKIVHRDPETIKYLEQKLETEILFKKFQQYIFFDQWFDLKNYANKNGINLIGDIPIFVAFDSADVWSNPEFFQLDESLKPLSVAGVPPDYFSETGQLWGNPLYDWQAIHNSGYSWWIERFSTTFSLFDIIRLDHFRGFETYWSVPYGEKTAINGKWMKGPVHNLFNACEKALGKLPIIAEDLGDITDEVRSLRKDFGFPGMRILQFAFSDDTTNDFLPFNFDNNTVVYPGTHDNDTTLGWFNSCTEKERHFVLDYLGTDGSNIAWDFIRIGMSSVADTAIFALQDILSLDTKSRMNTPSVTDGNWEWRFSSNDLADGLDNKLLKITKTFGR